jgi:hypothetical protein
MWRREVGVKIEILSVVPKLIPPDRRFGFTFDVGE